MTRLTRTLIPLAIIGAAAFPAHAANSTWYADLGSWSAAVLAPTIQLQTFQDRNLYPDGWPMMGREFLPGVNVTTNMPELRIFINFAGEAKLFGIGREIGAAPYYDVNYTTSYNAVAFDVRDFERYTETNGRDNGGTLLDAGIEVFFADATSRVVTISPNPAGDPIFFGITADQAISRIRFTEVLEEKIGEGRTTLGYEEVSLDNFRVAQVAGAPVDAQVPEPSAYLMLLSGLGLLGFMARRRTR